MERIDTIHDHYMFRDGVCIVDDSRGIAYLERAFYHMCSAKGMNRNQSADVARLMAAVASGQTEGHWTASVGFSVGINAGAPVGQRQWRLLSDYNAEVDRIEQAAAIAASAQCIRESRPRTVGGSRRRRNARRRVNR
jgi:hypothetical protein